MAVDPKSIATCHLQLYAFSQQLGTGSGFIVQYARQRFLVTNYHVLSGCHPDTRRPMGPDRPDRVLIPVFDASLYGVVWRPIVQNVIETGAWVEHPRWGSRFDVVALPIHLEKDHVPVTYDYHPGPELATFPGSDVVIVGFPEGIGGPGLSAIWKQGSVASEVEWPSSPDDISQEFFYIDSNTRKGMSGSPVLARRFGTSLMESGEISFGAMVEDRVLGVYAGRALEAPDMTIGRVWKWRGVQEILDHALRLLYQGKVHAYPTTIGLFWEASKFQNTMELDLSKSVQIRVSLPGTDRVEERTETVFGLLKDIVLLDPRFSASIEPPVPRWGETDQVSSLSSPLRSP